MTSLVTPYEYSQYFNTTAIDNTNIQTLLNYSTAIIKTYCDRDFEAADYNEWLESVNNFTLVSEYPINRLYFVKPIKTIATLITSNTANEQIFEKNGNSVYITLDGISTISPLSSYSTIGTLSANLITSGINIVLSDVTNSYPTVYLQDLTSDVEGCFLVGGDIKNIKANIDKGSKRSVLCDQDGEILIKYNAGYTFSQDTSGHDAILVQGNVPNDLQSVCLNLTKDIAAFTTASYNSNGAANQNFKSENIGDYNYTRFDNNQAQYLLSKYSGNSDNNYITILDSYRKKSFG